MKQKCKTEAGTSLTSAGKESSTLVLGRQKEELVAVAAYNVRTMVESERRGTGMTSVFRRLTSNLAVTSSEPRAIRAPAARRSVRQGIALSVLRNNSCEARAVRSRSSCHGIVMQ